MKKRGAKFKRYDDPLIMGKLIGNHPISEDKINTLSMVVHTSFAALKTPEAEEIHVNNLAMCWNIMGVISERVKVSDKVEQILEYSLNALLNVKARAIKTGRYGGTGDELNALSAMCVLNDEFLKNITVAELIDAERTVSERKRKGVVY